MRTCKLCETRAAVDGCPYCLTCAEEIRPLLQRSLARYHEEAARAFMPETLTEYQIKIRGTTRALSQLARIGL